MYFQKTIATLAIVIFSLFLFSQLIGRKNVSISQGSVGYVVRKPYMFGNKHEFKGILIGPNSTGWRWRIDIDQMVDFRPITIKEDFSKNNTVDKRILTKDKINVEVETAVILGFRKNPSSNNFDEEKFKMHMKEFFENYGPKFWTNRYKEIYRKLVREKLCRETYVTIKDSRTKLASETKSDLDSILENTPIYCMSVTFNNVNPPEEILTEESRKRAIIVMRERIAQEDSLNIERNIAYNRMSPANKRYMLDLRGTEILQKAIEGGKISWGVLPMNMPIAIQGK